MRRLICRGAKLIALTLVVLVVACSSLGDGSFGIGGSSIPMKMTGCEWGLAAELTVHLSKDDELDYIFDDMVFRDNTGKTVRVEPMYLWMVGVRGERSFSVPTNQFSSGSNDLKLIISQKGRRTKTIELEKCMIKDAAPDYRLSAGQFAREYMSGAGDVKYKGKIILVEGQFKGLTARHFVPILKLRGSSNAYRDFTVDCHLGDPALRTTSFLNLSIGQIISVKGQAGSGYGNFPLFGCTIEAGDPRISLGNSGTQGTPPIPTAAPVPAGLPTGSHVETYKLSASATVSKGAGSDGWRGELRLTALEILSNSIRVHSQMSVHHARNVSFKRESCIGRQYTYLTDNIGNTYTPTGCGGDYAGEPSLISGRTYTGYVEFGGLAVPTAHTFTYHSWFSSPIKFTLTLPSSNDTSSGTSDLQETIPTSTPSHASSVSQDVRTCEIRCYGIGMDDPPFRFTGTRGEWLNLSKKGTKGVYIQLLSVDIEQNEVQLKFVVRAADHPDMLLYTPNIGPVYDFIGQRIDNEDYYLYILDESDKKVYSTTGFVGGRQSDFNKIVKKISLDANEEVILSARFPMRIEGATSLKFVSPLLNGWQWEWGWDGIKATAATPGTQRKIILMAGLCSSTQKTTEDTHWMPALKKDLINDWGYQKEDIIVFSYSDKVGRVEYKVEDTFRGVGAIATNLGQIYRAYPDAEFDIIAHSLGGVVALDAMNRFPFLRERTRRIVTVDSPIRGVNEIWEWVGSQVGRLDGCEPGDVFANTANPTWHDLDDDSLVIRSIKNDPWDTFTVVSFANKLDRVVTGDRAHLKGKGISWCLPGDSTLSGFDNHAMLLTNPAARADLLEKALAEPLIGLAQQGESLEEQLQLTGAIAPGARVTHISGTSAAPLASASLVQPLEGESFLLIRNLPSLPPDREYQLWRISGEAMESAGTFSLDCNTNQPIKVARGVAGVDAVGVSIEPKGGSAAPTGDIVLLGDL